ncbi:unnamed protein product [Adineta ricciae]|uniref:Uncharacterized protein n=1 Tax=Adineta ricciae TaxID=249248 RepID=A0A814KF89_ADIRI|nr:unnamed protein product [Adineta ricciae]CAF1569198.1 unnamed protein product [Adineta ricciae]
MTPLRRDRRDRHGCDLPTKFVKAVSSCGPKGKCCDVHDACYKRHGCTRGSWLKPFGACARCNAAVVACIQFQFPGKSTCCAKKNCGKPR